MPVPVYIVHAKKGYEFHEQRLRELLKGMNLPFEFVTDGDPTCFTNELLAKYFHPDIKNRLSTGVLSCTLNHIFCYEKMVQHSNPYAVVFENDPFFIGDFKNDIEKVAAEAVATLPAGFMISLENTTLRFPPYNSIKPGQLIYGATRGRCAGAYLLDLTAAKAILKNLETKKCGQVIDWWHNTMIDDGVFKMYWAHPPLVEQGSHNGLMSSTISSKDRSIVRQLRWKAQKFYKTLRWRLLK